MDTADFVSNPEKSVAQSVSTGAQALVSDVTGIYEDGWCEPVVSFKAKPLEEATTCQMEIWLKPESPPVRSRFSLQINSGEPFECTVPHDLPVTIQTACDAPPGSLIEVAALCDNVVTEKGEDMRNLSYKLKSVRFS